MVTVSDVCLCINYTAPESGELSIEFVEVADNASWHHYSFTNEEATDIYLDPTPNAGRTTGC